MAADFNVLSQFADNARAFDDSASTEGDVVAELNAAFR